MKIIIPIGGIGQRFKDEGFDLPKPLININGKSMIYHLIESLSLSEDDEIYIVYNNFLKNFNFENIVNFNFKELKIKFHCLDNQTRGASETVLNLIKKFDESDLEKVKTLKFYKKYPTFRSEIDALINLISTSKIDYMALEKFFEFNDKLDKSRNMNLRDYNPILDNAR
jgi:bifunctional N-acetylglucosamine-1-phosphate-uridyltransferase/glucosamine-1-phosphate-acetyltransferase GlmU-like protein